MQNRTPTSSRAKWAQKDAQRLLWAWHAEAGSWEHVARALGANRGFLHAIARGKRPAPASMLRTLGLRRRVHRWGWLWDQTADWLRWSLENRTEMPALPASASGE